MRASSTQKTYDEAFLACSTAVYFESKNNEPEALRSWRSALDHIYYHNAHRPPSTSTSRPASETEKALQESLHQLELQCKERVDLLEALKRSREEANENVASPSSTPDPNAPLPPSRPVASPEASASTWLGGGTVPPVDYTHLSRPPLPYRPSLPSRKSSGSDTGRANINPQAVAASSLAPSPVGRARDSRTPSPEKKGRMLRTLRPGKDGKPAAPRLPTTMRSRPPEAAKAATQAWGFKAGSGASTSKLSKAPAIVPTRSSFDRPASALDTDNPYTQPPASEAYTPQSSLHVRPRDASCSETYPAPSPVNSGDVDSYTRAQLPRKEVTSPTHSGRILEIGRMASNQANSSGMLAYRNEYPMTTTDARFLAASAAARSYSDLESGKSTTRPSDARKTSTTSQQSSLSSNKIGRHRKEPCETVALENDDVSRNEHTTRPAPRRRGKAKKGTAQMDQPPSSTSEVEDSCGSEDDSDEWKERVNGILKNLPRGVDKSAAQQILNEIVIQGDEVRWDDVAGLEVAKSALKETVVYPFLRPDLFMGLREPARGMLLFGPPGTGKTMLARAVATESSSTFFAISASSLTSKFLGESEKLVRALFALAKLLAPSIIFVDEIDSLLSSRSSSSEHEATRRIKTEFLIQWSDLAKAAAGREQGDKEKERGDATRVLVLAATNLPWAIDEAARRRFVRRQYIPLPEDHVRKTQVKTLLSHQKHELNDLDLDRLVQLTDGFSGSDITALAKDAAMGPLRSLGERLLHMTIDEIRPIRFEDFQASLQTIRPSVSKQGLNEYEAWAKEFGERGG